MAELSTLVRAAQQGDKDAYNQVVLRFQDMAYATAYAMIGDAGLAQDAAQEALIDAYLSLANLREPEAFPGWFRRIVLKHSDRQTRGKQATMVPIDDLFDLRSALADPAL
ncbi:MAG: sigma factor [Caldilineaceae bacterium]